MDTGTAMHPFRSIQERARPTAGRHGAYSCVLFLFALFFLESPCHGSSYWNLRLVTMDWITWKR